MTVEDDGRVAPEARNRCFNRLSASTQPRSRHWPDAAGELTIVYSITLAGDGRDGALPEGSSAARFCLKAGRCIITSRPSRPYLTLTNRTLA